MDTSTALGTVATGLGSLLMLLAHGVFASAQPTLDILVPMGIAYLVHRYVTNQTVANTLTDMAGAAYLNLGSQFAAGTRINFDTAKSVAVAAAVAGADTASKAVLAKLTQTQVAAGVNAKLGQLLASDSAFNVTDPHGKLAAQAGQAAQVALAAALAATAAPAPVSAAADQSAPVQAPTPSMANFDITALVQDAVRQGLDAAVHNGVVQPAR